MLKSFDDADTNSEILFCEIIEIFYCDWDIHLNLQFLLSPFLKFIFQLIKIGYQKENVLKGT